LPDFSTYAASVAALQLGLRHKLFSSFYITLRSNALANDFINERNRMQQPRWLTGHALTFTYNSLLGPIELSGMYSEQAKAFQTYVNLGISF
jgi:NTE family protein